MHEVFSSGFYEEVKPVIIESLKRGFTELDPKRLIPEAELVMDLGFDSLDYVTVVMDLEDHFDIEFQDDALEKIKTYGELVLLVDKMIMEQN